MDVQSALLEMAEGDELLIPSDDAARLRSVGQAFFSFWGDHNGITFIERPDGMMMAFKSLAMLARRNFTSPSATIA